MPRFRLGLGEWSPTGFLPAGTEVERDVAPFGAERLPDLPKAIEPPDEEADPIPDVIEEVGSPVVVPARKGK